VFFGGCVIIAAAIWIMAWPLYFPPPIAATPTPAQPAPPAAQQPPQPPPPWVTQEEIEVARKEGHILINYSATELLKLWQQGQNIGLYLNKWIKIEFKFSAPTQEVLNKKTFLVTDTQVPGLYPQAYLSAYFDKEKTEAKLVSFKPGDTVRATCQFDRIDRKDTKTQFLNQTFTVTTDRLFAYYCGLL
jgi:hypothetical protein